MGTGKIGLSPFNQKDEEAKKKIEKISVFNKNSVMFATDFECRAPLAARPVPWIGRGRRLVELTSGS